MADKFTVGLIQMRCTKDAEENLSRAIARIAEAGKRGAQIICMHELFRGEYFCRTEDAALFDLVEAVPGPATEALSKTAKENKVALVVSLFERRAAGLTDTVARASAGAIAHLPIARVTNLNRIMEELKEAGYWLVGLDENADKSYIEVDYTSPTAIVMGGEGKGLHELTRKRCDFVVSLPTTGPVRSLNVSVATGVVLFEAVRQRHTLR